MHMPSKGMRTMKKLNIVFMGTPDFSVPVLEGLIENYQVVLVVTQPDKEVGRHRVLTAPPVKKKAEEFGIPVFQPVKIKEDYQMILDLHPDLIVTCAYGQIIPDAVLECATYGAINVHASLLPKLRGGAPIHHAILDHYPKTGVTIMYMVSKMDAGDILSQEETVIMKEDTLGSLHDRLSQMGRDLLLKTIPDLIAGNIVPIKQDESEVTYGYNIKREEERIRWDEESTLEIFDHIRGLNPHPGAYTTLDGTVVKLFASVISDSFFTSRSNGEISRIYKDGIGVCTKDGEIIITELQVAGKKRMSVKEYFNGVDEDQLIGKKFV